MFFLLIREVATTLASENDTLRDQLRQTEKDTLDVVTFMKKQAIEKDADVKYH